MPSISYSVATESRKRPRTSALANEISASSSSTPEIGYEGGEGKPIRKRARFAAEEIATEFADVEEEWVEENYDEYPDEENIEEPDESVDGLLVEGGVAADGGESGLAATEQVSVVIY